MIQRLTPNELDISFLLRNSSLTLTQAQHNLLSQLQEANFAQVIARFLQEEINYEVQTANSDTPFEKLDVNLTLASWLVNQQADFINLLLRKEDVVPQLLAKLNDENYSKDLSYKCLAYFISKYLLVDNSLTNLTELLTANSKLFLLRQNTDLHQIQHQFFAQLIAQIMQKVSSSCIHVTEFEQLKQLKSLAKQQVLDYLAQHPIYTVPSYSFVVNSDELREYSTNQTFYLNLEQLDREKLFGTFEEKDGKINLLPGYIAYPNTILAIDAKDLLADSELTLDLLQALSKGEYNLRNAVNLNKQVDLSSFALPVQAKVIITFSYMEQEELNAYVTYCLTPEQVVASFAQHTTNSSFMASLSLQQRNWYLQAYSTYVANKMQVTSSFQTHSHSMFPSYVYQDSKRKVLDPESFYLHAWASEKMQSAINYQELFSPKLKYQQSPTSIGNEQNQTISKENNHSTLEILSKTPVGKDLIELSSKAQNQLQQNTQEQDNYLSLIAELIALRKLLGFNDKVELSYLELILQALFKELETINHIYWPISLLKGYYRKSHGNYQKLANILVQESMIHNTEYQATLRHILSGYVHIETFGKKVGIVNGLGCIESNEVGKKSYGTPFRISCLSNFQAGGTHDVDAELDLSGKFARRANIIGTSYLKSLFPESLDFSATILTEQLYEPTDGDSATVAGFIALISSLSNLPINQDIAITGSMDQYGNIQAVGGVNDKIESFYDLCKIRGLANQSVVIPSVNRFNLILKSEVIADIAAGRFNILVADHVSEVAEYALNYPFALPNDKVTINQAVINENDNRSILNIAQEEGSEKNINYIPSWFNWQKDGVSILGEILRRESGEDNRQTGFFRRLWRKS